MVTRRHAKKRSNRFGLYVLVLLIAVLGLSSTGGAVAKYVQEHQGNGSLAAKEFYFTSNLLVEGGEDYVLNSGTTSINITLGNNADGLRYSDDIINYAVSVVGGPSEDAAAIDHASGTLANGGVSNETVTLSNLKAGYTYEVAAVGSAGYKKTLRATLKIAEPGQNVYKHVDATDPHIVVLTVWAENVSGALAVDFTNTAGLIPDNTDPVLSGVTNFDGSSYAGSSFSDASSFASPYSSRTYVFLKDGSPVVNADSFSVVLTDSSDKNHTASPSTL